jgi:hypothetical protein
MKILFKVTLSNGEETYVIAEDLSTAGNVAECAYAERSGNRLAKTHHVTVLASESGRSFDTELHIAQEQQPAATFDGPVRSGGIYG